MGPQLFTSSRKNRDDAWIEGRRSEVASAILLAATGRSVPDSGTATPTTFSQWGRHIMDDYIATSGALAAAGSLTGLCLLVLGVYKSRATPPNQRGRARWIRRQTRMKLLPVGYEPTAMAVDELIRAVNVQGAMLGLTGGIGFLLAGAVSISLLLLIPSNLQDRSQSVALLAPLAVSLSAMCLAWVRLVARRYGDERHNADATPRTGEHDSSAYWWFPLAGVVATVALVALTLADVINWPASDTFERTLQLAVLSFPWLVWLAPAAAALIVVFELASLHLLYNTAFSFTSDSLLNTQAVWRWRLNARSLALFGGAYTGVFSINQSQLLRHYQSLDLLVLVLGMLCFFVHLAGVALSQSELRGGDPSAGIVEDYSTG